MLDNTRFVKRSMVRKVTAHAYCKRLLLLLYLVQSVFHLPSPTYLHTFIPPAISIKNQYRRGHNNATPSFLLSIIEQQELCVAFIVRRHCGNLHHTVPHNESRVTCLAVYSNILFYNLDEASSNAVSSEGWDRR